MIDPSLWLQIALLVLLLVLSAFFSMSETAFIRTNNVRIRSLADQGDRRAKRLEKMLRTPEKILSTILVGNNLVNIAAASLATFIAVKLWGASGAITATFVLTAVVLIFSEITPKTLAVRRSEETSLVLSLPLRIAEAIFLPIAWFTTQIAWTVLRLFGLRRDEANPFVTQAEIEAMVKVGAEEGEVEPFEQQVIEEVFDFTETAVHRVVTSWDKVNYLPKESTLRDALEVVKDTGHSRIPIVDGDFEHVMGFVHAKDLLKHTDEELKTKLVTEELRGVLVIRHDMAADKALARMQKERKLMSVVQDADGNNLGIATVEDLVEEIIGEILDEFDDEEGVVPGEILEEMAAEKEIEAEAKRRRDAAAARDAAAKSA